jgi:colicin import membrane protein
MRWQPERSSAESYFWPIVWALGFHVLMFAMLFVSFAMTPDLPPARPVVQATLYKLQSQSKATVQTNQKIAGEAIKTKAPTNQVEQLEQKKSEQDKLEVAEAAEQAKAEAKAEAVKEAAAAKAEAAEVKKVAEAAKAVEVKELADLAKKKNEEEKKKAEAEAQKKKAADEAKKQKTEDDAKKKAAEEAKKKSAEADKKKAADAAKKKTAAEASKRKAAEDKKAQALAELLSDSTDYQQAIADTQGDEIAGSLDDLIIKLVSDNWARPPSARNGMSVEVQIDMLPDGTITGASVTRSSGDAAFDGSAVSAVRKVGRIPEMQQLDRATFDQLYRQRRAVFKPEDLSL